MKDDPAEAWLPQVIEWILDPKVKNPDGTESPFDLSKGVTTVQVLRHALGIEDFTQKNRLHVARVLRALGYQGLQVRYSDKPVPSGYWWRNTRREVRFFKNIDVLGTDLLDEE